MKQTTILKAIVLISIYIFLTFFQIQELLEQKVHGDEQTPSMACGVGCLALLLYGAYHTVSYTKDYMRKSKLDKIREITHLYNKEFEAELKVWRSQDGRIDSKIKKILGLKMKIDKIKETVGVCEAEEDLLYILFIGKLEAGTCYTPTRNFCYRLQNIRGGSLVSCRLDNRAPPKIVYIEGVSIGVSGGYIDGYFLFKGEHHTYTTAQNTTMTVYKLSSTENKTLEIAEEKSIDLVSDLLNLLNKKLSQFISKIKVPEELRDTASDIKCQLTFMKTPDYLRISCFAKKP